MRFNRLLIKILYLPIISLLIAPPLFSQSRQKPRPRRPVRQEMNLVAAIAGLLAYEPPSPDLGATVKPGGSERKEETPPADDAPLKDLVRYWRDRRPGPNEAKPSDEVRRRLLEAAVIKPAVSPWLLDHLPENPDTHDRLYKMTIEEEEDEDNWRFMVRAWLKHNSRYFRDELIKSVRTADTADPFPHEDVGALVKLDWETARPFIEKFAVSEKPGVWWPALLLLYEHAIEADDATAAEGCRRRLKEIVARNPSSSQMAIMALMKGDWDG